MLLMNYVKRIKVWVLPLLAVLILASCSEKRGPVKLENEADVSGKTIGVPAGSLYDIEMSKRSDVKVERYTTTTDIIAALQSGKIDAAKLEDIALSPADKRRQGIKIAFRTDQSFDVAYALRHDEDELQKEFNQFLAEAKQSGLHEHIRHRWLDTEEPDTVKMPVLNIPENAEPVRVAIGFISAPLCFCEGSEWKGFEIEILQHFSAYLGRPMDYKNYDFSAANAALQTGKADILTCCLFVTEERKKAVLFTDPYHACHPAYFVSAQQENVSMGVWDSLKDSFYKNLIVEDRWRFIVDGLLETIIIAIFSLLFGTLFAVLICWMRMCRFRWLNRLAGGYINLLRGIPLLVLLMIMFYVVLASTGFSATVIAIISFSMVFAAYVSEMFRTAIQSVNKGQSEAGVALGFTSWQTFFYIVLPQAARAVLPVYKGEAVSLFKNTSIVGYIAIQDLTKASDLIRSRTFDAFFPLIVVTIIYFLLAWLLGKALDCIIKTKKK